MSAKSKPRFVAKSNAQIREDMKTQRLITVAVNAGMAADVGHWLVHPAIGVGGYSVTLKQCALRAGTFAGMATALDFARALRRRHPRVRTLDNWLAVTQAQRNRIAALRERLLRGEQ